LQRTIYIKPDTEYYHPIKYVMHLIQRHAVDQIIVTDRLTNDCLIFDHTREKSEPIAIDFFSKSEQQNVPLPHETFFPEAPVIRNSANDIDLVATIFYMVNCLQERNSPRSNIDHFGRFKYSASYQHRFDCVEENLVQKYIFELFERWQWEPISPQKSNVFLSHDIDALDGSWIHIVYDLLKQKRIITAIKALFRGITHKPYYRNIHEILNYHRQYGIKSSFFFIPVKGKGRYRIQNADYNIREELELLDLISSQGHSLGLHKSSKESSIAEELEQLPFSTEYNRYHFLSHQPHKDWERLEAANISIDASLGFAEHIGFRNSYGLPFHPYNPKTKEAFKFLEVPLMMMDGTLWGYMGIGPGELGERAIRFFEKNRTDCLISVLWHNTSLTEYPYHGLKASYLQIMEYINQTTLTFVELDKISSEHVRQ